MGGQGSHAERGALFLESKKARNLLSSGGGSADRGDTSAWRAFCTPKLQLSAHEQQQEEEEEAEGAPTHPRSHFVFRACSAESWLSGTCTNPTLLHRIATRWIGLDWIAAQRTEPESEEG